MPNQPATPARSIRIPDELWEAVLLLAIARSETPSAVVRHILADYLEVAR